VDEQLIKAMRAGSYEVAARLAARAEDWEILRQVMVRGKIGFYWMESVDEPAQSCGCCVYLESLTRLVQDGRDIDIPGELYRCTNCQEFRIWVYRTKSLRDHILKNYPFSIAAYMITRYLGAQLVDGTRTAAISSWHAYIVGQRRGDKFRIRCEKRILVFKKGLGRYILDSRPESRAAKHLKRKRNFYHDVELGIDIGRRQA